ncbi:hypothetical protein ASF84_01360 [Pseudomonas sp. Leaf127]|uniref:LytTR family DNA-binding domain-containing protein n=1 Tax=Pseudomonas sp. Leaf127 TaxID=1736267 RepID=UPI000702972F|nr:LytTR family DNA-binding domain-containing protein [Pseudomonas sp. Leaf127]KQQ67816.1 hypothetical protein ASF84_01360 [Pseudomonas sp. Leaf127]
MKASEELHADYIQSTYRRKVVRVLIEDISHFKAEQKYVVVYHDGGELLLNTPLIEIECIYADRVVRAHRNALVMHERLQSFRHPNEYRGVLAAVHVAGQAEPIDVSRRYTPSVRKAVEQAIAKRAQAGETP